MKTETVEEFLARGGKITKCPNPKYCPMFSNPNIIVFGKGVQQPKKKKRKKKKGKK